MSLAVPVAISFASPLAFLALLLVPAILLLRSAAQRRARRHAVRFPGVPVLAGVIGHEPAWRRHLPLAVLLAAVAALVVALARPERTVAVPDERASLMLVLDASRSMEAEDVEPNRLEAARRAALAFLDKIPERVRVGVVGFSDRPYTVVRPSPDRTPTEGTIRSLEPVGGTATGDALQVALDALPRRPAVGSRPPTAIVLLSDGQATDGVDPLVVARRAGAARIPVFTIALGTPDGVVPGGPFGGSLPVPPDPETMREIAAISGAEAYEVDDAERLKEIYERLGAQLSTKSEQREITVMPAFAGLVLLLGAAALGVRRQGRLP
ncbi:VWA domain-containing protein [Conexibacter sp. SYSU D00693]|uniref:VWA domain-containing protein n=1 Tax=Conexibacter sp. SYSU D00693 TaxID=2812560 RepID=UPI00196BA5B9|nr:VWA domain-containing protein [Conexibacter sp. SYSU D00693]